MASVDLKTNIDEKLALNNAAITSDTTTVGNEIDTAGFESVTFIAQLGVVTDGTYTPSITECDTSGGTFTAVVDADLIGTEAAAALTATNTVSRIGYIGKKRYVKFSFVSTGTSSGVAAASAVAVLGSPRHAPVA
jgi:hypothetical protein